MSADYPYLEHEAEKAIENLESGICYSGNRGVYIVDTIVTEKRMKEAAEVIRKLLEERVANETKSDS